MKICRIAAATTEKTIQPNLTEKRQQVMKIIY